MKYLILFFIILAFSVSSFSQTEIISTFKVTNYQINGENYDHVALDEDVALSFYTCGEEMICFANEFRNSDSQSYGGVFGLKRTQFEETDKNYARDVYQFTWDFVNTFDNIKGKASVTLKQIYIGSTVKMTAEIIVLATNDVLTFVGYLEE